MKSIPLHDLLFKKTEVYQVGHDYLRGLAADPKLFHVVCYEPRPGCLWFTAKLEFEHFPPTTKKNDDFQLHFTQWPVENGHPWVVISIPFEMRWAAEKVAGDIEMRLANGVPRAFMPDPSMPNVMGLFSGRPGTGEARGIKVVDVFPMDNDRVCNLENHASGTFHKSPAGKQAWKALEEREVERIFQNFRNRN